MKFLNFKKYIFSYITIIISFGLYYLLVIFQNRHYPSATKDEFLAPGTGLAIIIGYYFVLYLISCVLLILELLIRKFIIEKYFPKLKISINFSFPKVILKIYTIIFYTLFLFAILPFILTCIAFIITIIKLYIFDIM